MDGLECIEIKIKDVLSNNISFRYDAEFFNKYALAIDRHLRQKDHFFLHLEEIVSGPFGSTLKSDDYLSNGVPFIRIENIRGGFNISTDNMVYISELNHKKIFNSALRIGDIVLSKVGNSIGYYARVNEHIKECNISENNIGIKLTNYSLGEKAFILTFLNTKYGKKLTIRRTSGNAQPKLNVSDLTFIPIPKFSSEFYEAVKNIITTNQKLRAHSISAYKAAENILYNTLNIKIFTDKSIAVKSAKESFKKSGRLDAEYYQPKYDELFDILSKFATENLGGKNGLVSIKKSIEPGSDAYRDEGIPFVRVSDINKFELTDSKIMLSPNIVPDIDSLYPCKDTILLTKDGSVGIAYKLEEDRQIVTSGALLHLTIKDTSKILPDYLTLVLNSPIVQLQAERDCNGAIIQHWTISDIEKVVIPVLDMEKQKEITEKVQESFRLRKEAKSLLDRAIKAVEMAIEIDETTALHWLEWQN